MDFASQASAVLVAVALLAVVLTACLQALSGLWARRLQSGLEAQAQLETAEAIREVAGDVDMRVGDEAHVGDEAQVEVEPPAQPESAREHPPPHEGIAGAVDRFYAEALLQSKVWFLASVLAACVGLSVIVWEVVREVVQATNHPALDAILKTAPGLLTGAIAALFYRQANATRKHAADLLTSTQSDRRSETALRILSSIKDDGRREEIAGRLAMHLAGAPAAPARRSGGQGRNARPDGATVRRSEKMAAEPEQGGVE